MFGRLTRLVEPRESIREGDVVGAVGALLSSDALDMRKALRISAFNNDLDVVAAGAFVGPDGLDIGMIDPNHVFELVDILLETTIDDWRRTHGVEFWRSNAVKVRALETMADFPMTLDGEPAGELREVDVQYVPRAARVLSAKAT